MFGEACCYEVPVVWVSAPVGAAQPARGCEQLSSSKDKESMLSADLEKAVRIMVSPVEEIDKSSKVVLSLSTGALALLVGFLRDASLPIWARVLLGASVVSFGLSIFRWLVLARSGGRVSGVVECGPFDTAKR